MTVSPVLLTHLFIEDFTSFFYYSLFQSYTVGVKSCQG